MKVAIVTGAGTGVGAAVAGEFAARGWAVLVNYRASADEAEQVAASCRAAGVEAFAMQGDVAEDNDCRRLALAASERWGRIDALVNNAGITKFVAAHDLDGLSAEDWQRLYATNVVGAFQMARACAPALKATGEGAIVNLSSFASLQGAGSSIAYAVSKGAVNTLTLALARTLAPEVRVNAVAPSYTDTRWIRRDMDDAAYAEFKARIEESAPLGRIATPKQVADAVLWLVETPAPVTGELIVIDSGFRVAGGPRPPRS